MNAMSATALVPPKKKPTPPPAPLRVALPLFAASSGLFFMTLYILLPALLRAGASWFAAFNLALVLPMTLFVLAAFTACRLEGVPFTWLALRDRLRLGNPNFSTWLWTVALSVFMYGGRWSIAVAFAIASMGAAVEGKGEGRHLLKWATGLGLFSAFSWVLWQAEPWLKSVPLHQQPEYIKDFLSRFGPTEFMGIPLIGRWWVALYYLAVLLLCNVAGEELWWRGYLLPRQEVAHGRGAWMIHGTLWAMFHLFFQWTVWDLVRMVPTCCALSFVAQHRQNTWPGVIAHTFGNSALLLQIAQGVIR